MNKSLEQVGITEAILRNFLEAILEEVSQCDIDEGMEEVMKAYIGHVQQELKESLESRVDIYRLQSLVCSFNKEFFEHIQYDLLLDTAIADIAEAGGEQLAEAEDPVFAMVWYGLTIGYLQTFAPASEDCDCLRTRFETLVEHREAYERNHEDPFPISDSGLTDLPEPDEVVSPNPNTQTILSEDMNPSSMLNQGSTLRICPLE